VSGIHSWRPTVDLGVTRVFLCPSCGILCTIGRDGVYYIERVGYEDTRFMRRAPGTPELPCFGRTNPSPAESAQATAG
jgi:hypothetical protein